MLVPGGRRRRALASAIVARRALRGARPAARRRIGACAPPSAARPSGSCCCWSPARSTPSRSTSRARRSRCSALGAAGWIAAGAWGSQIERELGSRSVLEEQPLAVVITARSGTLPLPPGWIDEPLLPDPVRFQAGPALHARARRDRASGAAAAAGSRRRRSCCATRSGSPSRSCAATHEDEILVLPRTYPVNVTAAGGEATPAHARAALIAAAETEIDGLRPFREGTPASRIHWPVGRARPRDDGAQADLGVRLAPARRARPARAGVAGRARRRGPRRRLAAAALRRAARAARCCCPGDRRAVVDRARPARPGRRRTCAWRCSTTRTGPALTAAQNRRGLVVFVSARPRRPPAARARPHARRLPDRRPRRAARPPRRARGRRLPGLRGRADRRGGRGGRRRGRRVSAAAPRALGPRRPAAEPTLAAPGGAGAGVPRPLRLRRAAVDADARARRRRSARATRCSPPAPRSAACCSPGGCRPRARTPAAIAVAIAAFALALLGGGVADEQLLPGRWGELAAGIGRGISALPGARVPYRGLDEWTRLVICLGGTTLAVLAALARVLAAPPRARAAPRRARAADDALRRPGRRARPLLASSSRGALLAAARRRLPAPRAAADHRRRRGRAASPSR